jgi:hypothetical protein
VVTHPRLTVLTESEALDQKRSILVQDAFSTRKSLRPTSGYMYRLFLKSFCCMVL